MFHGHLIKFGISQSYPKTYAHTMIYASQRNYIRRGIRNRSNAAKLVLLKGNNGK